MLQSGSAFSPPADGHLEKIQDIFETAAGMYVEISGLSQKS